MKVNHGLVWVTLAHIEADPAGWDQRVWAERRPDGTVYCFGGRAVVLAGCRVAWELDLVFGRLVVTDGRLIEQAAAEVLGIAAWDGQSRHLFHPSNSLDDLRIGVFQRRQVITSTPVGSGRSTTCTARHGCGSDRRSR